MQVQGTIMGIAHIVCVSLRRVTAGCPARVEAASALTAKQRDLLPEHDSLSRKTTCTIDIFYYDVKIAYR